MAETPQMLPPMARRPDAGMSEESPMGEESQEIKISIPKGQIEQVKAVFSQINDAIQGAGEQAEQGDLIKTKGEEGGGEDPLAGFAEELNARR